VSFKLLPDVRRILIVLLSFFLVCDFWTDPGSLVALVDRNTLAIRFERVLVENPTCRPGLLDKHDLAPGSGIYLDTVQASDCDAKLPDLSPMTRPGRIAGMLLLAQHKYELAQYMFVRTSEYHKDDAFIHYLLGIAAWRRGDKISAVEFWKMTGAERLWLAQAWACAVQNDPCALAFAHLALTVNPSDTDAIRDFGRYAEAGGHIEQAVAAYAKVLTMGCQSYTCEIILGRMYGLQFRWDDAINHYRRATELNPRSGEPYYALAQVFAQLCDLPRALQVAEQGRRVDPDFGWNAFFLKQYTNGPERLEYDKRCAR